ncbi:MAG: N-formylglutamate amidohydrolase [Sporichthyaceae bacterium]
MTAPASGTAAAEPALWWGQEGVSPVVAVAVHAGHAVRPEIDALLRLDETARLREEDPFTDAWTALADTRIVAGRSRFEVDLNRPRADAVYLTREQSWGLDVWQRPLHAAELQRSLAAYDSFYAALGGLLDRAERAFGHVVVYDLHTYNHRRQGADAAPADPAENPQVNLGTGSVDRARWAGVVESFLTDLREAPLPSLGRPLDVRENVRFRGGHLARWVHERFPRTGCVLAVEVKKFFMDEHTAVVNQPMFDEIGDALAATVPGVLAALERRS